MSAPATSPASAPPARPAPAWGLWLAWTWVVILVLAAVAELFGLDNLRLALDLQRHFGT